MNRKQTDRKRVHYFRSVVFKRLFLSYAVIILLIFGASMGWSAVSDLRESSEMAVREWEQRAASWGTWMDQQLMQAQMLCASVNASESARTSLQTVYVEKKTMNSMQLYNMLGDLTRIMGSVRSTSLYSLILAFQREQGLSRLSTTGSPPRSNQSFQSGILSPELRLRGFCMCRK